jgi:hypothetical protein
MKIPWTTERCIVCMRTPRADDERSQMTDAHVIPESVGGRLSADFLCKPCNDEMGRAEAFLPRDITVRLQVDAIRGQLPPTSSTASSVARSTSPTPMSGVGSRPRWTGKVSCS